MLYPIFIFLESRDRSFHLGDEPRVEIAVQFSRSLPSVVVELLEHGCFNDLENRLLEVSSNEDHHTANIEYLLKNRLDNNLFRENTIAAFVFQEFSVPESLCCRKLIL